MRVEELVHQRPALHVALRRTRLVERLYERAEVEHLDVVVGRRRPDDLERRDRLLATIPVVEDELVVTAGLEHEVAAAPSEQQILIANAAERQIV